MKKVVSINLANIESTGEIVNDIARAAEKRDILYYKAYPETVPMNPIAENDIIICGDFCRKVYMKFCEYTGWDCCSAVLPTLAFLRKLDIIKPDLVHLHNLHSSYINVPILFMYLKRKKIKVLWTLHDCWSFTGHCPYFTLQKCDRWKVGCGNCPQLHLYPVIKRDTTKWLWKKKKKWFNGVPNMHIITPSLWLADLVKESYLKNYDISVIYNGLDLSCFSPVSSKVREEYGIPEDDYMILGVAVAFGERKGIDVLIRLAEELPSNYHVVLVGNTERFNDRIPNNIIKIPTVHERKKMAELYTAADVLANPTREEVFGLVNVESLACGTPVVVFNTGGCPEIIDDSCGRVVECDDFVKFKNEIIDVCQNKPFDPEKCRNRAMMFESSKTYKQYVNCYEEIMND